MLTDSFGRTVGKLRISVTDRCDLRCTYCMPAEGLKWLPKADLLSFEDICKLCEVAASLGVRKIRLTGGEPLVRRDLPSLIKMIREQTSIESIGMTTNGLQLTKFAESLAEAGLSSVNVSLDSLDPERFHQLTRRDALPKVLDGLQTAAKVFPGRVKVNCVAMPGLSDEDLKGFVNLATTHNILIRFIEFMPLDAEQNWRADSVVSGESLKQRINALLPLEDDAFSTPDSPAREFRFKGSQGGIGFINSVSEPFCNSCDRIRITADGRLRTCLFSVKETNLLDVIRNGTNKAIAEALRNAVWQKEAGHRINEEDFVPASRTMSQIGG